MRVVARVQGHPSRTHLHEPLCQALELPTEISLHESDPPSPWAGYRKCLTDLPECSHLLVIQDDAVPCLNFAAVLERVVERNSDFPIVLFLSRIPSRWKAQALKAMKTNTRYLRLLISSSEFFPVVAVVWPRAIAERLHTWAIESPYKLGAREPRSDDAMTAKFLMKQRQEIIVTVPSLVQHPDTVSSVKGRNNAAWGKDGDRVALLLAEDGLDYEW